MAKKYLDLTGLSTLWEKITGNFATQTDLSDLGTEVVDINSRVVNLRTEVDQLASIGDVNDLETDEKSIIGGINELHNEINNKQNKITYGTDEPTGGANGDVYLMEIPDDSVDKVGDLSTLTTTDKSCAVAAINEHHSINNASLLFDTSKRIIPTLSVGGHQSSYGGCYYYKIGTKVHVHIGVNGLTANTLHTIFTLPAGYRPDSYIANRGVGGKSTTEAFGQIASNGTVYVMSEDTYCLADIEYEAAQ